MQPRQVPVDPHHHHHSHSLIDKLLGRHCHHPHGSVAAPAPMLPGHPCGPAQPAQVFVAPTQPAPMPAQPLPQPLPRRPF